MASEGIHKRTFTLNIPQVWLCEMSSNHRLCIDFDWNYTHWFISFLSSYYGSQASNKFITRDNGFYDLLERDDEVMVYKGFQIQEDLLLHFCRIVVPPGARVKPNDKV